MKSKTIIQALALICLVSTTSCVSFIEKIFFKADGSGTYEFSIDMSSLVSMMQLSGEDMDTDSLLSQLNMDSEGTIAKLEAISGVNNVRPEFNKETGILSMVFDFDNLNALNQGISTYLYDSTKTDIIQYQIFTAKGNTFERSDINLMMDAFQKTMKEGSNNEELDMDFVKMMFSDMYYATEITFEKGIKSVSNKEYEEKGNTIIWKTYPFNDLNDKTDISVKVKIK